MNPWHFELVSNLPNVKRGKGLRHGKEKGARSNPGKRNSKQKMDVRTVEEIKNSYTLNHQNTSRNPRRKKLWLCWST